MRYSGFCLFGSCLFKIRFSASSSENNTALFWSAVLRRFSRISMRFSVSSVVVSEISVWKSGVLVSAATWGGVLADPVIVEKAVLFGP